MILSRRLKYIVRILVWGLIGIHIGIVVFLNIPYVQNKLASAVSTELEKLLNTEVSVGHIEIGWLNRIHIEDVKLDDLQGNEMLNVHRLSARFEWKPLLDGKIVINSVQLIGFGIHLRKETPKDVPNIQFVLDALASKDTLKESSNLDLRINSILINRGKISYDVLSIPETPGKFNASHVGINDFSASISLKAIRNDSIHAIIRRLTFHEKSGVQMNKLGFKLIADNNQLTMNDFKVKLESTDLNIDSLRIYYDKLQNLPLLTDDVSFQGKMKGHLVLKDLAPIIPVFKDLTHPLNLDLVFNGQGKDINIPLLSLSDEKFLNVTGHVSAVKWNDKQDMFLQTQLSNFSITQSGINYYINALTGSVPSILQRMEHIQFKGNANGYLHHLKVDGLLKTAAGSIDAQLLINSDKDFNQTYSGGIFSKDLNLGKLLGDSKFGYTNFNIDLKGFNYHHEYPESYVKGIISSFDYSNYRYENITLDGIYKNGGFNGHLALDDSNGTIQIDGSFNTAQRIPDFNLHASVRNFRPHDLNLSDKYENSDISLNLTANFAGSSIDDINGQIYLDSLTMNTSNQQTYFLENLTIKAEQIAHEKEIQILSPFMTAVVRGDYSYQTIPTSIMKTIQRYLPSLLTTPKHKIQPTNNFRFDIQLSNADFFNKLFFVPLDVHMPLSLKGYVNDNDGLLRLEGYFPELTYNGVRYESATLLCENPSSFINCNIRGSMLMNSGAMVTMAIDAEAENDQLRTTINWGNNTDITYGGEIATITHFHKTENSKSPFLQADIDILPTNVILNDTIWHIRSSHVGIDSSRISIDNFLFERPNQYLRVDGRIAKNELDSCIIDLRNIDVQYVLDIVKFDDVEFGGLATGRVSLKNIYNKPDLRTHLNVHHFTVNQGLMGEADIKGIWDNELPGIRLKADIEEHELSKTNVTGYVSPKLKALDLLIQADSTNLDLLTPYFDGIFSEFDARANGQVRLHGGFKTLDFEGGVRVNLDTKVDIINTHLQLHNDSVYINHGEFILKNARLFDNEGNSGYISGGLRHTHLKNLMYHFDIEGNNLLMYHSNDPGDMLFYGKIYGTGNVVLDGGNNALNIDIDIQTGQNTTFTYVTGLTTEATSNQFITFVDKTPKRLQDSIQTEFYHFANAMKKKEDDGPPMDLRINMLIDATPDANMKVVMDPVAGDNITARGRGNFQVNFYNKGDLRIFGNYTIDEGMYKLSMKEIIHKDFVLQAGSTVTFTGDPYQANLDVQAVHTVNSVSLSDLSTDASLTQSTVKVNCLMNLTGSLANPTIKFDLDLPTVNEEDRELVRSATSTEEQMNTQIIYLLGIGKFYAYDYNENPNRSSSATSSLAFNTLSGQLNNMLSQAMENENWNIGANFSTGQEGWSDVEAEAILTGRLMNNRLLINGNFGYRENVMSNTNFIGDFEAIWLLTKNGEFRLRGYNQTNDRYFTKSTLTTQGIGFIYKKDFDQWTDLFQWFMRKQNQKKRK
ncbi:MAG: translocation/assembly module TamB domain-containing protein [Bacteroidaceae bacterium]|nr:translocation/assembly module TamB domain-containing protein [Bacteroidaceae bacterium]